MITLFLAPAFLSLAAASAGQPENTQTKMLPDQAGTFSVQHDQGPRDQVCYKMRTYIFARNDGAAPKLVRETTCPPARPRLNRSNVPQARAIPAN